MKEMKIVDGRLDEKSRGFGGEMISYHYWKIGGKKHETLEIPDVLDAHVEVGKPTKATYLPGKDRVNRVLAIQSEGESVRSVVSMPFLVMTMGNHAILPLAVAIVTIFIAYGFWKNSSHHGGFHGSAYQITWLALNLFVTYRYMIKPVLIIKRGIKTFREYCENASTSTKAAD